MFNVESQVAGSCSGRSTCSLEVTNQHFGDPCWLQQKRLDIDYSCSCLADNYRVDATSCLACPRGTTVAAGAGNSAADCKWSE